MIDFRVRSNHRLKMKGSDVVDNKMDLVKELIKSWNKKEEMIPILVELEIRERVETIQTTALLKTARILKRVPEN